MNDEELAHQHDLDEIATSLARLDISDTHAVLVGWVAIAEFSDADGRKWLAVRSGSAPDSDHFTTSWQRRGYMHEVLESGWIENVGIDFTEDDPTDE